MGKSCCENKASEIAALRVRQGSVLKIVLWINALMFVVELTTGVISRSTSLMADSLDMFGDAAVYGFSLYALNRGAIWRARAGLAKGLIMALFGIGVSAQVVYRLAYGLPPEADLMGAIGVLALAANLVCLWLLYSHRADDINMRSTWLCSRNDIVANVGVLCASILVAVTHSVLPDIIVGGLISVLFLKSAFQVIFEARDELTLEGSKA